MGFFSSIKFQAKKNKASTLSLLMVGTERLELSHLAALEPKSSASTNFATSPSGYQLSVGLFSNFGRGSRIRTLTNGFGDRHATITPILYSAILLNLLSKLVGTERLELSHLAALEPKSSASTNFATSPMAVYIIEIAGH